MTDGTTSETPKCLKVIDTVVGGEQRRRLLLREALRQSGFAAFPVQLDELLSFVRAHLMPLLSAEVGVRLATVVFEDIDRAVKKESARAQRRRVGASVLGEVAPDSAEPRSHDAPPSTREVPSHRRRCSVLVVDRDRIGASMLARGMVTGGCDVTVAEALSVDGSGDGERAPDVVVMAERDAIDMAPSLRSFLVAHPDLPVLVRVSEHERLAASMVQAIGSRRCVTIARTAPTMETVGAARRLAEAS